MAILKVPAEFWDAAIRGDHVQDDLEAPFPPVTEDVRCLTDKRNPPGAYWEHVFEAGPDAEGLRSLINLSASSQYDEIILKRGA